MATTKKAQYVPYTKIKTIADARKVFGISQRFVPDVSMWPEFMQANKLSEYDVQLVIAAINGQRKRVPKQQPEQWVPDWTDKGEKKYYPWWWIEEVSEGGVSGRGLSLFVVHYDVSYARVGPRLVFESDKKARHFVKYFKALAEKYYFTK